MGVIGRYGWMVALLFAATQPALGGIKVGVTPGALADSIEVAAREARDSGLQVEVVEFGDWTTPNLALENGDLDLNYFQHQAFLENAVGETGYDLRDVALGILPNIGLYSERFQSLDDIPKGARVAVASDPVNQGRGLSLLQAAGLIGLDPNAGWKAGLDDVTDNPRDLEFVEIEGPQLVRAIADVDLAQGYPAHFVNAGRADFAGKALIYSGLADRQFAIRFVTRDDNATDPEVARFIGIYQNSANVRSQIDTSNAHDPRLYSLPWLD
ncbi:MetQ/NlpA family ABC transporter substrate-binding protein [Paracoccus aestuariivivens]|uniref:MetQ/NlpA family ABC transporter substrate-binding protein n=1 Tax=Paracoccus aestuariivivens TaxID=1820333 RepID=A0A6L6J8N2_9RHOB|nr:MetQ/NlpA family ABC transporter substrate-binding protein [Paracoccus aestuariivivens]MTH78513.1 MetQ/NlpA family ABC transporter substrate-binding protein [Paracoccus aestuariivivens]